MRKLLFKAKRKDNNEWVFSQILWQHQEKTTIAKRLASGVFLPFDEIINKIALWCDREDKLVEIIPETLSEFTGLLDASENKIFENDCFRELDGNDTGVIVWDNDEAMYRLIFDDIGGISTHFGDWSCKHIEIIGNVHDKKNDSQIYY